MRVSVLSLSLSLSLSVCLLTLSGCGGDLTDFGRLPLTASVSLG